MTAFRQSGGSGLNLEQIATGNVRKRGHPLHFEFVRQAKLGASCPVEVRTFQSNNHTETTECCVDVS